MGGKEENILSEVVILKESWWNDEMGALLPNNIIHNPHGEGMLHLYILYCSVFRFLPDFAFRIAN